MYCIPYHVLHVCVYDLLSISKLSQAELQELIVKYAEEPKDSKWRKAKHLLFQNSLTSKCQC